MVKITEKDLMNDFSSPLLLQKRKSLQGEEEIQAKEDVLAADDNNKITILNNNNSDGGTDTSADEILQASCESNHLYNHGYTTPIPLISKVLDQLIGTSSIPIMVYNFEGRIFWTNSSWDKMLGKGPGSSIGFIVKELDAIRDTAMSALTDSVLKALPEVLTFQSPEVFIETDETIVRSRCTGKRLLNPDSSLFGYIWFVNMLYKRSREKKEESIEQSSATT